MPSFCVREVTHGEAAEPFITHEPGKTKQKKPYKVAATLLQSSFLVLECNITIDVIIMQFINLGLREAMIHLSACILTSHMLLLRGGGRKNKKVKCEKSHIPE